MSVQTDIKLIDNASKPIAGITNNLDILGEKLDRINRVQLLTFNKKDFLTFRWNLENSLNGVSKEALNVGESFKNGFEGSFGMLAKLGASIYAINSAVSGVIKVTSFATQYSDNIATTTARINLINDGLMNTHELWNEIYNSSIRARVSMLDTADVVQRIKMNTGDVFSNNKEVLKFTENLSKSFKIAGISAQGISTSMLQLAQSLSSGVLQGDEFKSLKENAPNIINLISDYMGVTRGELEELSSQGKITTDIVKNAILGATDEINQKFDEMPMTWEEVNTKFNNIAIEAFQPFLEELGKTPEKIDELSPHWEAFAYIVSDSLTQMTRDFNSFFDGISRRTKEVRSELSHLSALGLFTTADEIKTEKYGKKLARENTGGFLNLDYYLLGSNEKEKLLKSTERDASARFILENANKKGLLKNDEQKLLEHLQKGGSLSVVSKGTVISHDEKVSLEKYQSIINTDWEKRINDKANEISKSNKKEDKDKGLPINIDGYKSLDGIARDVSDISKGISNLNDINKAIMEINEATYHNNVINQFTGNIQVISYGTGEEEQKAIGKVTENAVRKVIFNDYQNTQAMGVYA